jgi:hypothetical protein
MKLIIILLIITILIFTLCNSLTENMNNTRKVIVSMTTIPERIEKKLKLTLDSLQLQTVKPDIIYINIPKKTLKGVDYPINKLNEIIELYSNVKLNIIEKDLGPITKVIPVLPFISCNDYLVLVDDDTIYKPQMIEYMIQSNKIAVGYSGRLNMKFLTGQTYNGPVDFLETYAGVLYRDNILFGLDKYNESIGDICIKQDDIVIGKFLKEKGVIPYIINKEIQCDHDGSGTPELRNENLDFGNKNCYQKLFI